MSKMPQWNNKAPTDDVVMGELINTVRNNTHMILCFSPSSDKFREKFIKFPVLFNNTTIVWLLPWPEDALISVVKGFFNKDAATIQLVANEEQKNSLFNHMGKVHININLKCEEYLEKFKKYVYVTPKSFLCFIDEYIRMYVIKREEVVNKENTINMGLKKLAKAEEDIKIKSAELDIQMKEVAESTRKVEEKENQLNIESEKVDILEAQVNEKTKDCLANKAIIEAESEEVQQLLEKAIPELERATKKCQIEKKEITGLIAGSVPGGCKYLWECVLIVMTKRLNTIQDMSKYDVGNKGGFVDYYVPSSWDMCGYYTSTTNDSGFFQTLKKWGELIKNNEL